MKRKSLMVEISLHLVAITIIMALAMKTPTSDLGRHHPPPIRLATENSHSSHQTLSLKASGQGEDCMCHILDSRSTH